jgi:ubiquinone/menaquinone biosynthesis C-methylase UbiE
MTSDIQIPPELAAGHGGPDFVRFGIKLANTIRRVGGLGPSETVLDIGCGPGRMAVGIGEILGWANDYIGFDIKLADIEAARTHITSAHPSFRFEHVDIHNIHYNRDGAIQPLEVRFPAADGSIDFCLATSLFTHMFPADVQHYLHEARRVMKPGARFFSTWFVLDEVSRAGIAAGTSPRFSFAHRLDRVSSPIL